MFSGFDQSIDTEARKRFAASSAASAGIYGLIAIGLAIGSAATSSVAAEKVLDVTFRSAPKATPALPPPAAPPVPKDVAVKKVRVARAASPLVAPELIPDQKLDEADPSTDAVEVGEVAGDVDPSAREGVAPQKATPPPAPAPKPRARDPINLPEEAEPPQPDASNVQPDFPEEARTKGIEGLVILKIVVTETGRVAQVDVMRGDEPFVSVAVAAVKSWRYEPARVDGQAISVFRIVKIPFKLKG